MEPALRVADVHKSFGAVRALRGVSWEADAGRVTCLLGSNGAGKSTTIGCAAGLHRPDEGEVRVLGIDPVGADPAHRARVGVMLQDGGLPNTRAARDVLAHFAAFHVAPRHEELSDRLGIGQFGRTTVRRLSGGQKQRLALAVALVGSPDIAFLDEPTAGLDPHARRDVWQLVEEERARGVAIVVSTHPFEETERLADHVVIMHAGLVVAQGTPAQLAATHPSGRLEDAYFAVTDAA